MVKIYRRLLSLMQLNRCRPFELVHRNKGKPSDEYSDQCRVSEPLFGGEMHQHRYKLV
jgi:hypothetical protein